MLSPDRPYWGPLLIIQKGNIVTAKVFVELPLVLGGISYIGIIATCNYFGSICESRGLSNLKTREIKTI